MKQKMTIDYMVDLHKFLYMSNDTDWDILAERVRKHLSYIPRKKLYRYRKSTSREIDTLSKNSIWLSDPESFSDIFDATIPLPDDITIASDYSFRFTAEVAYKAWVNTVEEGENIPSKEAFIQAIYATKEKYPGLSELEARMHKIYGSEYEQMREMTRVTPKHSELVGKLSDNAIELFRYLGQLPRRTMAIASFTTDKDNRSMWENYAKGYTGFCVEYDFRHLMTAMNSQEAWDILHFLPIDYKAKRQVFDHKLMLENIVMQDTKQAITHTVSPEEYLKYGYQAVTTKLLDYQSEKEWRLVMPNKYHGLYAFPYASAIYLGKDMTESKIEKLLAVGKKLCVPVFLQIPAHNGDAFEYIEISSKSYEA